MRLDNLGQMGAGDTRDGTEDSSSPWTEDRVPSAAPGACNTVIREVEGTQRSAEDLIRMARNEIAEERRAV